MKKADLNGEKFWDKVDGVVLTLLGIMVMAIAILISTLAERAIHIMP